MTDNKFIDAFKRMLTMTLALIMVLGTVIPITTQEASAFDGKKGSKYTVTDGGRITYGSGEGGYSNSRKCDLGDDLGSRYSYCVQPAKLSPGTGTVTVDKVVNIRMVREPSLYSENKITCPTDAVKAIAKDMATYDRGQL